MPTITPQGRATIGGSPEEYRLPRSTQVASTGMNLPTLRDTKAPAPALVKSPAAQSGQPDPSVEETTSAPAVTLSPQLTALARRQQKLQQEIQAHREKEAAFTAKEADYVPKSAFKAKLRENAAEALKELGTTYEELTEALLAQQQGDDPVRRLASEVAELKKSQEENVSKQFEATLKQYRAETDALVAADPKAFHFIMKGKKSDQWNGECPVTQHIVETWQENPEKVLTVEQAAKEIEEVLREDAKASAEALRELDPPREETEPAKKALPPPQRAAQAQRTLTQQVETAPTRTYNQFQHLSMKERIAQAIARAQK